MCHYAKVIVLGSPITKSNFKLHNKNGRAILPNSSGKYHDRYALYEEEISYTARLQNPNTVLEESLIAKLRVYYKSEKRHPDTINITKSIFDGIEKSGLIVNDAQIRRIITEEYYDKENPRFELELYAESIYNINYSIEKNSTPLTPKIYTSLKKDITNNSSSRSSEICATKDKILCSICNKKTDDYVTGNNGKTIICKKCLRKML